MENGNETGFSIIGIGPGKVESMTIEAIEAAKNSDVRLYEAYTALWPESELEKLEEMVKLKTLIKQCFQTVSLLLLVL